MFVEVFLGFEEGNVIFVVILIDKIFWYFNFEKFCFVSFEFFFIEEFGILVICSDLFDVMEFDDFEWWFLFWVI